MSFARESTVEIEETGQGCPECGGQVDDSTREVHCTDCGLVLEDTHLDRRPDPAELITVDVRERHDDGLGNTRIGKINRDGSMAVGGEYDRLRRLNRRIQAGDGRERGLRYALGEVTRLANAVGLDVASQQLASRLIKQASEAGIFGGGDLDGFAAGAVLIACRINQLPYGRAAIRERARNIDSIEHGYAKLRRELDVPVPPAAPATYVRRIADAVGASNAATERAEAAADAVGGTASVSGRKPQAVAAACLYLAADALEESGRYHGDDAIRQADLADAAGCCAISIRNQFEWLRREAAAVLRGEGT